MGGVFNVVNMHVYHYAGNNPVKYVDPDGREIGLSPRIEIQEDKSSIDWGEIGQRTLGLFVTGVGLLVDHVGPPLLSGLATVASGGSGAVATPLIAGACKALGKTLQVAGAAIYFSTGSNKNNDSNIRYKSNPKHHQNARGNASKEPQNAKEMFEKSVQDPKKPNTRWYRDKNGVLHRFQGSNNEYHWNGSFETKPEKLPGYIDSTIRKLPEGDI